MAINFLINGNDTVERTVVPLGLNVERAAVGGHFHERSQDGVARKLSPKSNALSNPSPPFPTLGNTSTPSSSRRRSQEWRRRLPPEHFTASPAATAPPRASTRLASALLSPLPGCLSRGSHWGGLWSKPVGSRRLELVFYLERRISRSGDSSGAMVSWMWRGDVSFRGSYFFSG